MYPWTTPPTSWPTPPQSATPSSTWPPQSASIASTPRPPTTWPTTAPPPTSTAQPAYPIETKQYLINPPHMSGTTPTPVEQLFGQPSALHPTWPSSTSPQPTASTMPPLSFASLATAPHAGPAPHLVPTTTPPLGPDTTTLHTNLPVLQLQRHPHFRQHGTLLQLHLTHRPHHLHLYRAHLTHLVFFNLHHWLLRHRQFLQLHLITRQSKQPQRFDQKRNLTNYAAQLQRLLRLHLPLHLQIQRLRLHRLFQQKWQRWALQHNNSQNLSVSFKLNNR